MDETIYPIEAKTLFSESQIWQINRDYYQDAGIDAWRQGIVPHHMTSNSMVGKTYAELILGFLKDLVSHNKSMETVYILELGAGHGRLAFHILQHLEKLVKLNGEPLPKYCYILSDIIEEDLDFFANHPQFKQFLEEGKLDYAYFDGVQSTELQLRHSKKLIQKKSLHQPIITIANYFFDSLPNDLFLFNEEKIHKGFISLSSTINPELADANALIPNLKVNFDYEPLNEEAYEVPIYNDILKNYNQKGFNTHLFFPKKSMECISNVAQLSTSGTMLLSMDKGFHLVQNINNQAQPDFVSHGSFSIWVNYHALGQYCERSGGLSLFPANSSFHLQLGCLLFLSKKEKYNNTIATYERVVNDFGPDDFNSIKRMSFEKMGSMDLVELLTVLRMSYYDSGILVRFLPRIKEVTQKISIEERFRLEQALDKVWDYYFNIGEPFDLGFSIGGLLYDLGFYEKALVYFNYSVGFFGPKVDTYYNRILTHYQLRQDFEFSKLLSEALLAFPNSNPLKELTKLDLDAV